MFVTNATDYELPEMESLCHRYQLASIEGLR
jgi:hypothetical protein